MDNDGSLRQFLMSRRARLRPEDVGLPASPTPRRQPGLRREEVAVLAGVSVDYYARLEQGRIGRVSDQVLTAIEQALRLDVLECRHLRALVETRTGGPRRAARSDAGSRDSARAGLWELVRSLDPLPAMVQSRRMDVLAANASAKVLLTDFDRMPRKDRNIVRWLFTDPRARERYPDWDEVAANTVAALRGARDPLFHDPELERLVGELSVASPEFAARWADYRLFQHSHGTKRIFHQTVGVLDLRYETFPVPDTEGQTLTIYTAPKGSAAADRLHLLLSWNAPAADATQIHRHSPSD
ncbi:helix-turn-helix transcriptional regulator [Actinacidiphila alni]|nr:helix-turn-helix transcriptional regulator [Actinacidiphila alni]